jgi:hypothetical protein
MRRLLLVSGLLALLWVSPAGATTTIGQLPALSATPQNCGPSSGGYLQSTVTSGTSYTVPANGIRITAWSTRTLSTSGQQLALTVYRPLGGSVFQAVTHDGPHPLTPLAINRFSVNIPVRGGDLLGLDSDGTNFPTACGFGVAGETGEYNSFPNPPPADGDSQTFNQVSGDRLNVTAEIEVSSAFSFGAVTRNKKKGKATAVVHAAGPGSFVLSGKGLQTQQASLGNTAADVSLPVVATGKTRKKLRSKGKARVTVSVAYAPQGGAANTQAEKIKLVKKL